MKLSIQPNETDPEKITSLVLDALQESKSVLVEIGGILLTVRRKMGAVVVSVGEKNIKGIFYSSVGDVRSGLSRCFREIIEGTLNAGTA